MAIQKKPFGTLETGEEASLFLLSAGEISASFCDYGACLCSLLIPAPGGPREDVVLGFSTLSGYAAKQPFFGATVGRYANRIGGARFDLGGTTYRLEANDGPNLLHGGRRGFDKRIWRAEAFEEGGEPRLRLELDSPAGEEGFPGALKVLVLYGLSPEGVLSVRFEASTDAPTILNLTNHSYFNLGGEGRGSVLDHELVLKASRYLPVDAELIPTGALAPVEGTPFDFRRPKRIGEEIEAAGGYDHCYVIDRPVEGELTEFASVFDPRSGRRMRVSTTLPGVQFYTGNFLAGVPGKRGSIYDKHGGFCLETEFFPDSPNRPAFPSSVLNPGELWRQETRFAFEA